MLGKVDIPRTGGWEKWQTIKAAMSGNVTGVHDLYFVFKGYKGRKLFNIDWWRMKQ